MTELIADALLQKITNAKYLEDYKLELSFNDGFNGVVNLKEKIFNDHRTIFKPLRKLDYFKKIEKNR